MVNYIGDNMRFKITLKGNVDVFPSDFDDIFATIIYEKLLSVSEEMFDNFEFYNFSYFNIEDYYEDVDGSFYSRDSKINFTVSSVNEDFLRYFLSLLLVEELKFNDYEFVVVGIELLENPDFTTSQVYLVTSSPIYVNINDYKFYLNDYLVNLLKRNYFNCYGVTSNLHFDIYIENYEKHDVLIDDEYANLYQMNLVFEGDINLIQFAWDVGLGKFNYKGYGMLDIEK